VAEIADDAWRQAEAAMNAMLRSRGIDPDTAADVRQAVAVRAVERHRTRPFQTRDGFVKWAVWVAWNQATDFWRAEQRRRIAAASLPDLPDVDDGNVEERARMRVAIAEVARTLSQLTRFEREAVEAPLRPDYIKSTPPERERRYEARATLRRVVRDFPAVVAATARRTWRRIARSSTTTVGMPLGVAVVALLLVTSPDSPRSSALPQPGATTGARESIIPVGQSASRSPGSPAPTTEATGRGLGHRTRPVTDGTTDAAPRLDVPIGDTTGVHVAAPPNDHTQPLLCTQTFATPRTCLDLPRTGASLPRP
jgi:hypothetical protein